MIKLRLRRMGAKKRPSYRIVAADSRSPRDGRVIESFGFYDPITEPATVRIDEGRARHWLSVGAQPTDTVRHLFQRAGVMNGAAAPSADAPATDEPAVAEAAAAEESAGEEPAAEPAPTRRRRTSAPSA